MLTAQSIPSMRREHRPETLIELSLVKKGVPISFPNLLNVQHTDSQKLKQKEITISRCNDNSNRNNSPPMAFIDGNQN